MISVYSKEGLKPVLALLKQLNIKIFSTGGTFDFIESQGLTATKVEDLTGYPSILGGRVKTLHPKVFGGILARRGCADDRAQVQHYEIPEIDLVIVDLYPFEQTLAAGASHEQIIEKIDIGGVALIRAAAKNYDSVLVISTMRQYQPLCQLLEQQNGATNLEQRQLFAAQAFANTAHYDTAICNFFNPDFPPQVFARNVENAKHLRYGENPHQKAAFYGDFDSMLTQLHGKEISYNNLLDIDAAIGLIAEFDSPTVAILKHNNACGLAQRSNLQLAWTDALAADPVSAFGGVIVANRTLDLQTAEQINKIFFEVLIAPDFADDALKLLFSKKNRIVLKTSRLQLSTLQYRSVLNGVLVQERDRRRETLADLKVVSKRQPTNQQIDDMLFANIVVKHSKSNAIVLVKDGRLLASGIGQTSRVDAVRQAVDKAKAFALPLQGAVMASDAFFPFADGVEVAANAGIDAVIQPGGSVRDQETIDFCNNHNVAMVFTGFRHFKH